ncbi:MAG: TIGR00730 family Rossman fold protein [Bacteroidales bacterium]
MNKIAVFCGSSAGNDSVYSNQAYQLGQFLAKKHIELIYGGGSIGLMGAVANGALDHNGRVTGVIPAFLNEKEIAHDQLHSLIEVNSMHERKKKMHDLSEAVIALPGGYGTLEELFEMLTWGQLGLHQKPIALLNINGFYDPLRRLTDNMVEQGFLKQAYQDILLISNDIEQLIESMSQYNPPEAKRLSFK